MSGTMTGLVENRYRQWRLALTGILTLLAGGLLVVLTYRTAAHFGDLISLYFEAWVLQFLLAPPVDWLCKHRWPRGLAAGVVYLSTLMFGVAVLIWLVPVFVSPLQDLASRLLVKLGTLDVPLLEAQARHAIILAVLLAVLERIYLHLKQRASEGVAAAPSLPDQQPEPTGQPRPDGLH